MGYVSKTLASGEQIVHRARFNWTYNAAADLWLLFAASPLIVNTALGYVLQTRTLEESAPVLLTSLAALALGLILWLERMIAKWATEIVVTNQRFVYKRGFLARRASEVNLAMIEEVSFEQSLLGRILGYGTLVIRGAGVGVLKLPPIAKPVALRRAIQDAKGNRLANRGETASA